MTTYRTKFLARLDERHAAHNDKPFTVLCVVVSPEDPFYRVQFEDGTVLESAFPGEVELYPEHERLARVRHKSQIIGEFLEHLRSEGVHLCRWHEGKKYDEYIPIEEPSTEKVLADYFDIDLAVIEHEKEAMLDAIRAGGGT